MTEAPFDFELSENIKIVLANTEKVAHWHTAPDQPEQTLTTSQIMADARVKALIEVGDVMAHLLWEHPIVPSSVRKWVAAVAPFKETSNE